MVMLRAMDPCGGAQRKTKDIPQQGMPMQCTIGLVSGSDLTCRGISSRLVLPHKILVCSGGSRGVQRVQLNPPFCWLLPYSAIFSRV